ncbi:hypothetical protein SARC_09807 [Sphaeroforma arctica JP610]|uniref:MGAT4 conserved region domain-containing protein n=1 Tax=Sphaeroforma arctica JP610 TaxID=667725 RepID=A0A0L0FP38_9EUKA|nr:hypothetical protein SARC_09807 [Sphaeroforma arctica JP610]KNC77743.1 hypothetical protein SARC_09807 [Sphaeroforma arctica JP610]|eukprot:XP_014151645.1 hypothetical protein SARC_09807 [Sphaeroforma arctica JP610]
MAMTQTDLVVGIPTIRRAKHNYLLKTLESLLVTLENDESGSLLIVVLVGDLDRTKAQITIEEVQGRFGAFLDTGVLEIIQAPPESYFPDLHDLKDRFGDSKERTYWRSKQCLDFALLMEYSRTRGTYYLQLEDDVITTEGWFKYIMYYVTTRRREFFMIHFSRLGFIGKLFPSTVLKGLVQLFTLYFDEAPVDILLPAYGKRQKEETLKTTNTIFQHIGLDSSLEGKTQPLQDHGFTAAKKALQNAQLEVERRQMSGKGGTDSLAARMEEMKERRENRKRLPVPGVPAGG